jgi:hypothetical protein
MISKIIDYFRYLLLPSSIGYSVEVVYFNEEPIDERLRGGTHYIRKGYSFHQIHLNSILDEETMERVFYHEYGHLVYYKMFPFKNDNNCFMEFFAEAFAHYCLTSDFTMARERAMNYLNYHPDIKEIDRLQIMYAKQLLEIVIKEGSYIKFAQADYQNLIKCKNQST